MVQWLRALARSHKVAGSIPAHAIAHWTFQVESSANSLTSIAGVHSAVIEYLGSNLGRVNWGQARA